jgi:hypothetical protein
MTQLNKIIKSVLAEQITLSDAGLAKKIYNAKGLVWDNEYAALKAILAIKDSKQFNSVQKELQKLTGGRGVGQYVSEFIQVRDSMNSIYAPITIKYLKSIITHLTKIGTYKQTIDIFDKKLKSMEKWSKINSDLASSGAGQTQLAWETFAQRAAVDPEFKHNYLTSLQVLASFIPVIGWAVSAGIGFGNAYVYYQEGDSKTAGLEAIFAAIPGLGVAGKIGLGKVAPKFMAGLGKKVALNQTKNLTKQEIKILDLIGKNQKALKTELDNYFKTGIKKSAKKISRDKLVAAGKKYGVGLAKTSGTLASYMTIAQVYSNIYDANLEQITDTELLALNNKLDSEFERWLVARSGGGTVTDGVVPHTKSAPLNELDIWNTGINWATGLMQDHPYLTATVAAGKAAGPWAIGGWLLFRKRISKILSKVKPSNRFMSWNKLRRDRKFLVGQGLKNAKDVRALYKSGDLLVELEKSWAAVESEVAAGRITPKDAMSKHLSFIKEPGSARKIYDRLKVMYNTGKSKAGLIGTDLYDPNWGKPKFQALVQDLEKDPLAAKFKSMHEEQRIFDRNLVQFVDEPLRDKYIAWYSLLTASGLAASYFAYSAYKTYQRNKKNNTKGALETYKKMIEFIKREMKKSATPVVKKKPETPKKVEPVKKKTPVTPTPVTPAPEVPPVAPEEFELPD